MAMSRLGYDFRRTGHKNLAAAVAAFGTKVDDPVGRPDDVEIVFDDDDGVAVITQPMEYLEQQFDVLIM